MLSNVLFTLLRALKMLAIAAVIVAILLLALGLWINISLGVWHNYGDQTFICWLIGSALVLALGLVLAW